MLVDVGSFDGVSFTALSDVTGVLVLGFTVLTMTPLFSL